MLLSTFIFFIQKFNIWIETELLIGIQYVTNTHYLLPAAGDEIHHNVINFITCHNFVSYIIGVLIWYHYDIMVLAGTENVESDFSSYFITGTYNNMLSYVQYK